MYFFQFSNFVFKLVNQPTGIAMPAFYVQEKGRSSILNTEGTNIFQSILPEIINQQKQYT